MREHGMMFQLWGVRSIRRREKTQTRRIIVPQPTNLDDERRRLSVVADCLYRPGDLIYVKETFRAFDDGDRFYRADFGDSIPVHADDDPARWRWQSSMFMPKRFARLWLCILTMRLQRIQEIGEEDIAAEGCKNPFEGHLRIDGTPIPVDRFKQFASLWDSINAKRGYGWDANPAVYALTFELCAAPTRSTS